MKSHTVSLIDLNDGHTLYHWLI